MAPTYLHIARPRHRAWTLALLAVVVAALAAQGSPDAAAATAPSPAWSVESRALPTNFRPGGTGEYELAMANETGAALDATAIAIVDTLPAGLTATTLALTGVEGAGAPPEDLGALWCGKSGAPAGGVVVSCSVPASKAGNPLDRESMQLRIGVEVPAGADEGEIENVARVEGGGALPGSVRSRNEISQRDATTAVATVDGQFFDPDGGSAAQAGAVPFAYALGFARSLVLREGAIVPAGGQLREVRLELPPGLVTALDPGSICTVAELESGFEGGCPDSAAVGTVEIAVESPVPTVTLPLFAVSTPGGAAAAFGFRSSQFTTTFVIAELHDRDGSVSTWISGPGAQFRAARIVLWGRPTDPGHDRVRGSCLASSGNSRGSCPVGDAPPLLRLPTSCDLPLESTMAFDTWLAPHSFSSATSTRPAPTGCDSLRFEPAISLAPDTTTTDSPTGIAADFSFARGDAGESPATADLRRLTATLPPGLVVNPAGAGGRTGCSPAQIDLDGPGAARCPDESRIGSAQIRTPLLEHPLGASVYLAGPGENPFGSMLAVYFVAGDEERGITLKLAGRVQLDPETGRVTIVLEDLPQIPIEGVSLLLFGGARAPLRSPLTCGTYTSTAALTPWSAPYSGPDATRSSPFVINRAPEGASCPGAPAQAPHHPSFLAGAIGSTAGAFAPFAMRIAREDGSQGIGSIEVGLPPGLLARLAGVPLCRPGSGPCPQASRVGEVSIWAGAGTPVALTGGAYLSGAYKGAPASLTIEVPAVVGPFDLGTVRSRLALRLDPGTARLRIQSDPLPTILSGVPLDLRAVRVDLDRRDFTVNPTDCDPARIDGRVLSPEGGDASVSVPFQVEGCARLPFGPRPALRLSGPTHRSAHPRFRAILRMRSGEANVGAATVVLPSTEYLDNAHIRAICSRARFAADACPAGSVYGHARAWSPLLEEPLEGPVYLRSSDRRLPDVVAALDGQIRLDLAGHVDSVDSRIRIGFGRVPDVPVSRVELTMRGGRRGLLVNNTGLCRTPPRAKVFFRGHNGKVWRARPKVGTDCGRDATAGGRSARNIRIPSLGWG
jgi:hypothetical protein